MIQLSPTPFNTGNVPVCDSDPKASDSLGISTTFAGATLGRVMDSGDGAFTRHTNGQFEHLIDGWTAAAAFNCVIQIGQGGVRA